MVFRRHLIGLGATILAPCPHDLECPMRNDWCHFAVRLPRSAAHRAAKGAKRGFEDEKFSYVVAVRAADPDRGAPRILRHPLVRPGHVRFQLCDPSGELREQTVARSDPALPNGAQALVGRSLRGVGRGRDPCRRRDSAARDSESDISRVTVSCEHPDYRRARSSGGLPEPARKRRSRTERCRNAYRTGKRTRACVSTPDRAFGAPWTLIGAVRARDARAGRGVMPSRSEAPPNVTATRPPDRLPLHHITTRGNNKRMIFEDDDDRVLFYRLLAAAITRHDVRVSPGRAARQPRAPAAGGEMAAVSAVMWFVSYRYARAFNLRHGRSDHLLGRRFHCSDVPDERAARAVCIYIAMNPVRAGLCRHPAEWSTVRSAPRSAPPSARSAPVGRLHRRAVRAARHELSQRRQGRTRTRPRWPAASRRHPAGRRPTHRRARPARPRGLRVHRRRDCAALRANRAHPPALVRD